METGALPFTEAEIRYKNLHLQVLLARKQKLSLWQLDLLSPFWRLYVNKQSGAFLECGDSRVQLQPGRLYLVPAWVRFRTGLKRPFVQHYIHFDFCGFPAGAHRQAFQRILSLPLEGRLAEVHRHWEKSLDREPAWTQYAISHALIYLAMASALDEYPEGKTCFDWTRSSSSFRPALDLIEQNWTNPPSNQTLARACGMSVGHFIKKFHKAIGASPAQYGIDRRIELSAQWLTRTDLSIETISESLGFSDRFHFSKIFKQRLNTSPGTYRRLHLDPDQDPFTQAAEKRKT